MPYSLIWKQNDTITNSVAFPVGFPGTTTTPQTVRLTTSANIDNTMEQVTLAGLYLSGDPEDVRLVQTIWPYLGGLSAESSPGAQDAKHLRPELDGGLEICFDGESWIRFQHVTGNLDGLNAGYETDPDHWVYTMGMGLGYDGDLYPFDQSRFLIRFVIPPQVDHYHVLDLRLAVDMDIL